MKRIVLTGGGSAGHVTPNIALIPQLLREGWDIHYIGTKDGIERRLIEDVGIPYHPIAAGKLRRYFDLKNFTDPFNVIKGLFQATKTIGKLSPKVIFSKGGFVSVPVAIAGWLKRIPVVLHESDITPGLANRLSLPFATHIYVTFPETLTHLPPGKGILTGTPIRSELLSGEKPRGLTICGFTPTKPVLLVLGGSLGAANINRWVRLALPRLLERMQIVHLCGKGNLEQSFEGTLGYKQFEYVTQELPDLFAAADIVVSRAGANAIFELLVLRKPSLLVPLPRGASRGDQILNARSFEKQGYCKVLLDEEMSETTLVEHIESLYAERENLVMMMESSKVKDSTAEIITLLGRYAE